MSLNLDHYLVTQHFGKSISVQELCLSLVQELPLESFQVLERFFFCFVYEILTFMAGFLDVESVVGSSEFL